jgi:hypothetical protein
VAKALPWAQIAADPYARQFWQLEPFVRKWTRLNFVWPNDRLILPSDYVVADAFTWLTENVGPTQNFIRQSKFATGRGWAYTVSGVLEDEDSPYPHRYQHAFFFEHANDAMRFKLTWA